MTNFIFLVMDWGEQRMFTLAFRKCREASNKKTKTPLDQNFENYS
jgi:hypothetical protein